MICEKCIFNEDCPKASFNYRQEVLSGNLKKEDKSVYLYLCCIRKNQSSTTLNIYNRQEALANALGLNATRFIHSMFHLEANKQESGYLIDYSRGVVRVHPLERHRHKPQKKGHQDLILRPNRENDLELAVYS